LGNDEEDVVEASEIRWFALQVARRQEFQVAKQLRKRGYEEYVPATTEKRAWSDRTKQVSLPLFPGYAFCRVDPSTRLLPILTTPGVMRFVCCGNSPTPIDNHEIESIRTAVASGGMLWRYPGLANGERVELTGGPLAGCLGKIERVDDKGWVLVVSISLLNRSVAVEIDPDWVTLVKINTAHSGFAGAQRNVPVPVQLNELG
jgi:transcription antitermination factor NusG